MGLINVVRKNSPETVHMNFDHDGQRFNRHKLSKIQYHDFKEQYESCVLYGPGNGDLLNTACPTAYPRNPGCQIGLMLEKIKMPPGSFICIVNCTVFCPTLGTVEFTSSFEVEMDVKSSFFRIKGDVSNKLGRFKAQSYGRQFFCGHAYSS